LAGKHLSKKIQHFPKSSTTAVIFIYPPATHLPVLSFQAGGQAGFLVRWN